VRDIMTPRVLCVRPDQTVDQCMALMTEHRVRHLPVVDAGKITGVVSIGDVVKDLLSEQQVIISQLESYIHM
jgi:CBS domain-containing protein